MPRVTNGDWSIVLYRDHSGVSPVEMFLDGLDLKTQTRFIWSIEQLRIRNVTAREPLVRKLDGKLRELREASLTNIYRVIYCFFSG